MTGMLLYMRTLIHSEKARTGRASCSTATPRSSRISSQSAEQAERTSISFQQAGTPRKVSSAETMTARTMTVSRCASMTGTRFLTIPRTAHGSTRWESASMLPIPVHSQRASRPTPSSVLLSARR